MEIDACFDQVLSIEDSFVEEGRLQGIEKGEQSGFDDGQDMGLQRGFEFGVELGTVYGSAVFWQSLLCSQPEKYGKRYTITAQISFTESFKTNQQPEHRK